MEGYNTLLGGYTLGYLREELFGPNEEITGITSGLLCLRTTKVPTTEYEWNMLVGIIQRVLLPSDQNILVTISNLSERLCN